MINQTSIKRKLFRNFTSLLILQAANYLFPLISFPYLVRVLGPEKFGLINFAAAFTAYFNILTDYGFNLSATREISINRNNVFFLSKIFSSVLIIKSCIAIISLGVFLIILHLTNFGSDELLYLLSFGSVIGNVLFPVWFYQGIEQMKYITYLNVSSKFLTTIFIFSLISEPADYLLLTGINSIIWILTGIISLILATKRFSIKIMFPGRQDIAHHVREGWHLFISSIAINLYTTSTIFILGLFANKTVVGYFSAADKIRATFQGLISIISQTIFPHVSESIKGSVKETLEFLKNMFFIMFFLGLILSAVLYIFAGHIVTVVLGTDYQPAVEILRIICWIVFLVAISNVLGIQLMINYGKKIVFTKIIIIASILNLILSFILVPDYLQFGSSISVLITESIVSMMMIIYVIINKKEILSFRYV